MVKRLAEDKRSSLLVCIVQDAEKQLYNIETLRKYNAMFLSALNCVRVQKSLAKDKHTSLPLKPSKKFDNIGHWIDVNEAFPKPGNHVLVGFYFRDKFLPSPTNKSDCCAQKNPRVKLSGTTIYNSLYTMRAKLECFGDKLYFAFKKPFFKFCRGVNAY